MPVVSHLAPTQVVVELGVPLGVHEKVPASAGLVVRAAEERGELAQVAVQLRRRAGKIEAYLRCGLEEGDGARVEVWGSGYGVWGLGSRVRGLRFLV